MKVLILGGYGVFGGRLAELLADRADLHLLICGRSLAKAEAFCAAYAGKPTITPLAFDRQDIATILAQQHPDIVVDASGPFQHYGTNPYTVVEACIEARVHYLDLADGADFVFGISQFDERAKAANIFVLSGVSSFPVLTAAVIGHFEKAMEVTSVIGGIAPSPYAGVGLNVIRAVIGYAGNATEIMRDGKSSSAIVLAENRRRTIAPPGYLPLHSTLFSLVEVPDLRALPVHFPHLKTVWMGAGPKPEFLHRILNGLARLRHKFGLPSYARLAPFCYWLLNRLKFGEHRGGMFIDVVGVSAGQPVRKSWHLLAEGDDGPYIPSMACEAIIRKLLDGQIAEPGARSGVGELSLDDYKDLFSGRALHMGFRNDTETGTIYERVLDARFDALPEMVRRFHDRDLDTTWRGSARVERGKQPLAQLACKLLGLPQASPQCPLTLRRAPTDDGEVWTRTFGTQIVRSHQGLGAGRSENLIVERFGAFSVATAMVMDEDKLRVVPRHWRLWRLPLPRFLMPHGDVYETQVDGRFRFHVEIIAPLIGLIVRYQGDLEPVE